MIGVNSNWRTLMHDGCWWNGVSAFDEDAMDCAELSSLIHTNSQISINLDLEIVV